MVRWRGLLVSLGLGFVVLGGSVAAFLNSPPPENDSRAPMLASGRIVSRLEGVSLEGIKIDILPIRSEPYNKPGIQSGAWMGGITRPDGSFEIEGVGSGLGYTVVDRKANPPWTFRPLTKIELPAINPLEIELINGVTVTGRIVRRGVPVVSATLGLLLTELPGCPGYYSPERDTVSDGDGRFTFDHAFEQGTYLVFTRMGALPGGEIVQPHPFQAGRDGSVVDLGDLEAGPGFTLAGRVLEGDGQPPKHELRIELSMPGPTYPVLGDSLRIEVDRTGAFHRSGLPGGVVRLQPYFVSARDQTPGAPRWLSPRCVSRDPRSPWQLEGRLDRNVLDLRIVLDGDRPPPAGADADADAIERFQATRSRTIQGAPPQSPATATPTVPTFHHPINSGLTLDPMKRNN